MSASVNHLTPQSKAQAYQRVEAILESGPFVPGTRAVHRARFLYVLRWSQAGARISEMNDLGWQIASVTLPENQWQSGIRTAYRLDSKPLRWKPVRESGDYHEANDGPHSSAKPKESSSAIDLPLFAERQQ